MTDPRELIDEVSAWAAHQDDVRAAVLVGSHARGTAAPDSDVDIILLTDDVESRCAALGWTAAFGVVATAVVEDWGAVRSVRVHYEEGMEVEFSWAEGTWAAVPMDPGTRAVLADGHRVLHDPERILARACAAVGHGPQTSR